VSVYKTGRIFSIPESTLRDRNMRKENVPYAGPGPLFSKAEEQELVDHTRYMSSI